MSELRELKIRAGAAVVLPPSVIAGAREIEVEDGALLVARDDLTPDQVVEIVIAWARRTGNAGGPA